MRLNTKLWIGMFSFLVVLLGVAFVVFSPYDEEQPQVEPDVLDSGASASMQDIHPAGGPSKKVVTANPPKGQDRDDIVSGAESSGSLKLEKVMDLPWGDAPGQVGRKEANESAPEGPMSFFVDDSGRLILLDQVNSRVQVFDEGSDPAILNLPDETYQDVTTTEDGDVMVMDRLARKDIETYGPDGKMLASVGLEGQGVEESGGVTGMFQRPDGTWVEVEHSRLVRVANKSGQADPDRPVLPGRFSADGTVLLSAVKDSPDSALLLSRPSDSPTQVPTSLARIHFEKPLAFLTALESDQSGRIFVGAVLMQESSPGVAQSWETIVALDAMGHELGRVTMPIVAGALEQFRNIRVGADGALYWLRLGPNGAQLIRIVL